MSNDLEALLKNAEVMAATGASAIHIVELIRVTSKIQTEPSDEIKGIVDWVLHYYGYQPTNMSETEKMLFRLARYIADKERK